MELMILIILTVFMYKALSKQHLIDDEFIESWATLDVDNDQKMLEGLVSGFALKSGMSPTVLQIVVLYFALVGGALPVIVGYLLAYAVHKDAVKQYALKTSGTGIKEADLKTTQTNEDDTKDEFTGTTIVDVETITNTKVEGSPLTSAVSTDYVEDIKEQVNEQYSKVTGIKIDETQSAEDTAEVLNEKIDEVYSDKGEYLGDDPDYTTPNEDSDSLVDEDTESKNDTNA